MVYKSRLLERWALSVGFAMALSLFLAFAQVQGAWADEGETSVDEVAQEAVEAIVDNEADEIDAVVDESTPDESEETPVAATVDNDEEASIDVELDAIAPTDETVEPEPQAKVELAEEPTSELEPSNVVEENTTDKPEPQVQATAVKQTAVQPTTVEPAKTLQTEAIVAQTSQAIADGAYTIKLSSTYGQSLGNKSSYSSNAAIKSYNASGTYDQVFYFQHVRDGLYSIFSVHSGLALTVSSGKIVQTSYAGSNAQLFEVRVAGTRYALIAKPGAITASASSDAVAQSYNGAASQKFWLIEAPTVIPGVQVYRSAADAGKAIRAKGGSADKGAAAQAASYASDGTYNLVVQRNGSRYAVRPVTSGYYLSPSGTTVSQNANAYNWDVQYSTSGARRGLLLGNPAGTMAAKVSGGSVVMANYANAPAMSFLPAKSLLVTNGYYNVVASNGKCVDVYNGSFSNGANIQVFTNNGSGAQVFYVTDEGGGLYSFQSSKSFKVLEARYGGTGEGTNVWQYTWNATPAQLWVPVVDSSGRVVFLNAKSGKALTFSGSNVQLNSSNGSAAQHWTLKPTSKYSLTGDTKLDRIVANVLSTHTSLWSCFKYVSYNFSYRNGNKHWSGWSLSDSTSRSYAIEMYNYGSGNCYRFASLFAWLARGLGYTDVVVRTGWVVGYSAPQAPHGWVVIDGYICDPDMQHEAPSRNWYWQTWASAPTAYYNW